MHNNQKITDSHDMANIFNNYFIDVGKNLANAYANVQKEPNLPEFNSNTIYLNYTSRNEIEDVIYQLLNKVSLMEYLQG